MKKRTMLSIGLSAAATMTAAPLFLLGKKAGIGPFAYLHDQDLASLPGNAPEYSFDQILPVENSMLKDSRVLVLGSSVAQGTASMGYGISEYLQYRFGCTCTKDTVRGTTIADTGPQSILKRLKTHTSDEVYDLVICQLSTNDATKRLPVGRAGKEKDSETIWAGLSDIIDYVRQTWGCPLVFFTSCRFVNDRYDAMVAALHELTDATTVGVLDLWNNRNFNTISKTERKLYMADSIHPTMAGYRDWWGPELERQLRNYLRRVKK